MSIHREASCAAMRPANTCMEIRLITLATEICQHLLYEMVVEEPLMNVSFSDKAKEFSLFY